MSPTGLGPPDKFGGGASLYSGDLEYVANARDATTAVPLHIRIARDGELEGLMRGEEEE